MSRIHSALSHHHIKILSICQFCILRTEKKNETFQPLKKTISLLYKNRASLFFLSHVNQYVHFLNISQQTNLSSN